MKKIKISLIIIIMFLFIININKINAAEELPDDGGRISSSQVIQTKTGTGPFDENDEPGNDSSEDNNIVRSFDQVTWTVENTMVLNGNEADSYSGGRIYFEATLLGTFTSDSIEWDLESMGWIENAKVSSDGLTLTGYYQMGTDNITVPGKQTLVFVAKILGAANGTNLRPSIKLWLNGNSKEDYKEVVIDEITISAKPSYNLKLIKNSWNAIEYINENGQKVEGKLNGYNVLLQLYGDNSSKGLKGIEYPKGKITFDVELNLERHDINSGNIEIITDLTDILLYDYSYNGNSSSYTISDRTRHEFYRSANIPSGNRYTSNNPSQNMLERYIYKSGNYTIEQEGNVLHVTLENYDFDGTFPSKKYDTANNSIIFPDNVGCFSVCSFQTFIVTNDETTVGNKNYYYDVKLTNMKITSISDTLITNQYLTNDDESKTQYVAYTAGSYWNDYYFYDFNNINKQLHSLWNRGDGVIYKGSNVYGTIACYQNSNNTSMSHTIKSINALYKFDTNGFEITTCSDGSKFKTNNACIKFNMYYAAKKDGTGWNSIEEQNNTDITDLKYYNSLEELYEDGNEVCVGALFESYDGEWFVTDHGTSLMLKVPLHVKDNSNYGQTYQETGIVYLYTDKLDRTKESMMVEEGKYTSKPVYSKYPKNYKKTEYDENGVQISGTHNSIQSGNTLLVVGAESTIKNEIVTKNEDGSIKNSYDVGRNEYEVEYKLTPSIASTSNNLDTMTATLKITDELPKGLTYIPGSSNYGDPEITTNDNGTTILTWYIYDCVIGEAVEPITFKVNIDEEATNGMQYTTIATVFAGDIDKRSETLRQSSNTINIVNLSSHRLYKAIETPVIEKNGEIHYTVSYKNNTDEIIKEFQMLDILPYNGDSRGTNYTGDYTLDRMVVTQQNGAGDKISNDNLQILYTNDESVRNGITSKDENLGQGWNSVNSETIKQKATAYVVKGEIGAQGSVTVDIYLKTNGNKGLDKYVNSATAQVYKETEEMVTSNVVSQVVERSIEGIAWEDSNRNGLKDEGEQVLSNVEINLTDVLGQQVTDVNGNKVTSIKTDSNGYYKFENLPKGEYYVQVKIPNEKYELTEKQVGTNNEINSKFNEEEKETDKIEGLNSIDLPELKVSYVNAGFVKIEGSIEITKVDKEDNSKLIEGATFKVEKLDDKGNVDSTYNIEEQTTGKDGKVKFEGLEVGKYRVTETKAPSGYELLEKSIEVEITGENRDIKLTAENELKLILPLTGDTNNTIGIIIIGAIMIGISVILFVKYEGKVLIEKV